MTFKTLFPAFVFLLLFSSVAEAASVVETSGKSTTIKSKTSTLSNTGGNSGSGNITTGPATATSTTGVRSSGDGATVRVEAVSEADGERAEVKIEADGKDVSITKTAEESGAKAEASVETGGAGEEGGSDNADEAAAAEPESPIVSSVRGFFSTVGNFFRSLFK